MSKKRWYFGSEWDERMEPVFNSKPRKPCPDCKAKEQVEDIMDFVEPSEYLAKQEEEFITEKATEDWETSDYLVPKQEEEVKTCANCSKIVNQKDMITIMHNSMHRYVCSRDCMIEYYHQSRRSRMKTNQTTSDKKCVNCGELAGACMSASLKRNICPSWRPKPQVICPFCGERYAEEGKELCKICSAPQETNEEIREAFEKDIKKKCIECENTTCNLDIKEGCFEYYGVFRLYGTGYTAHEQKANAEIALLKTKAKRRAKLFFEQRLRIKELEQQLEALNDRCHNCKNLGTEKCIKCFFSQEYFWENNWERGKP